MKISIGKYTIKSDPYNLWIEEEYIAKSKKKDGTEVEKLRGRNITGYHKTWESLIQSFIGRGIGRSDAEDVKKLMADIADVKRDAIMLSIAAYREGKGLK